MIEIVLISVGAYLLGYAIGHRRGFRKGRLLLTGRLTLAGIFQRDVQ